LDKIEKKAICKKSYLLQ